MSWIWPAFAGFVASTAALMGSGAILILGDKAERAADWLLSFAIGTLLGAATLGLLPEALEHGSQHEIFERLLAGMLGFTLFERILHWRHPHHVGSTTFGARRESGADEVVAASIAAHDSNRA